MSTLAWVMLGLGAGAVIILGGRALLLWAWMKLFWWWK